MHHYAANRLLSLLLLLFTLPLFAVQTGSSQMRGKQYCEIIVSKLVTNYAIYNTLGINDCPTTMWNKVTESQVKKETGSSFVYLNGPRYWVIDGFNNPAANNAAKKTISGIKMQHAGQLYIKWTNLLKAKYPYYRHEVQRQTTWLFETGKPVYELIDNHGDIYVMLSYSVRKKSQTEGSLAQLGAKLTLPKGWKFKTGILKQAETIKSANNVAIIIQDNFDNTYQKVSHDFLKNA
ncbi:hypothetical protein [Legionella fallonii]|uniref:Uncharacterized protein n=1 Tax=Legionella fallonii LLAP-10 TaxID=1212491 RepID=A0A098G233_9GAMM|nr:hypothetical protein [Legionella fallonii]CEG55555.1 conserved exported protein of unknown function [Legionella fallonii LLAP-10]